MEAVTMMNQTIPKQLLGDYGRTNEPDVVVVDSDDQETSNIENTKGTTDCDVEYKDQVRDQLGDAMGMFGAFSHRGSKDDNITKTINRGRDNNSIAATSTTSYDAASIREYYKNLANIQSNISSKAIDGVIETETTNGDDAISEIDVDNYQSVNVEVANAYVVEEDDVETNRRREEEMEQTRRQAETILKEKEEIVKQYLFWKRTVLVLCVILIVAGIASIVGVVLTNNNKSPFQPFTSTNELYDAVDNYLAARDKANSLVSKVYGYPIGSWDVSRITDFSRVFSPNRQFAFDANFINWTFSFNEDISDWDVSSAVTMFCMFTSAISFNQDLSKWDVRRVTNFTAMFAQAKIFDQDLSQWETTNAVSMAWMFYGADTFNGNIATWDTSKVKSMSMMFQNAYSFNQDISNWDLSSVNDLSYMFNSSTSFEQNLCPWGSQISASSNAEFSSIHRTGMFLNTACPNTTTPVSFDGPWCTTCP